MITSLAHLAFTVKDMEKTMDYYVNKLGLTHAFSLLDEKGQPWIEYVKVCGSQFIEFFYGREGEAQNSGFLHLCLQVDDAEKTCVELMSRGVQMDVMPQTGSDHNIQFWAKDPDGVPIEFMQISPDSPQAHA